MECYDLHEDRSRFWNYLHIHPHFGFEFWMDEWMKFNWWLSFILKKCQIWLCCFFSLSIINVIEIKRYSLCFLLLLLLPLLAKLFLSPRMFRINWFSVWHTSAVKLKVFTRKVSIPLIKIEFPCLQLIRDSGFSCSAWHRGMCIHGHVTAHVWTVSQWEVMRGWCSWKYRRR